MSKTTLASLAGNNAKLHAVLLYHVVKGKVTAAQAMKCDRVIVGGAAVVKANVIASNGLIHVISKVLIP